MASLDYDALTAMNLAALHALWRQRFKTEPPPGRAMDLLRYEIAWRDQAARFGDLDKASLRLLRTHEKARARNGAEPVGATRGVEVGAILVREWRGQSYVVKVARDGFIYDGRTYRSLTQIARVITGAARSGPLFFGLIDK